MKRMISVRELILLGILLILVAYYFIVQGPVASQTEKLEAELSERNSEMEIAEAKAMAMVSMQKEIDAVMEKYKGNPPKTPSYSNVNRILAELNTILMDTVEYNISFGDELIDESSPNIVRRPISITYTTKTYKGAVDKIKEINSSDNHYLICNMTLNENFYTHGWMSENPGTSEKDSYAVTLSLMSFEYKE